MRIVRRMVPLMAASLLAVSSFSCTNKENAEKLAQQEAVNAATREELAQAVSQRDELLSLVTEINNDIAKIRDVEGVMSSSVYMQGDMPAQREQLKADLASIQRTLQERREKLAQLEDQLRRSNLNNTNLTATINSLREQIDAKDAEIKSLNDKLSEAMGKISTLTSQVDSLNTTVASANEARYEAEQESENLANELNTCYYAVGSKKELKDNKIIETGFLRKTKIMRGEFDKDFFTEADKRTFTRLPLHTKKEPKILTNQPVGSYTLVKENEQYVLSITNPADFWSLSNYLVIEVNN